VIEYWSFLILEPDDQLILGLNRIIFHGSALEDAIFSVEPAFIAFFLKSILFVYNYLKCTISNSE